MAYQVLARKYRPLRFGDVVGQDHVTRTLQNALEQGRIAHGYIFSGHRGIGKTTIARILASALNCQNTIGSALRPTPEPCLQCDSCREIRQGNAVDVIEIDAATNRGIDEIRELRDAARYRPARDRFKIYILDEAHQITDAAFNALLKTLEEPPDHIVFMLATTEPENIPQTIRSRCQHFSFHAVKLDDILSQLRKIAVEEDVTADPAALELLAEAGDGSMRDALSIMDQAIASAPTGTGRPQLSAAEIRDLMGTVPNTVFEEILEHVARNEAAGVLTTANRLLDAGNSPAQIARQFVRYLRNSVVAKIAGLTPESAESELLQLSPDERRRAARTAALFTEEELTRFLQVMLRTFDDLGFRQEQRFHLELGMLKLVHLQRLLPMEQFLSQLPRSAEAQAPRVLPPPRPTLPGPTASSSAPRPTLPTPTQNTPVRPVFTQPTPTPADATPSQPLPERPPTVAVHEAIPERQLSSLTVSIAEPVGTVIPEPRTPFATRDDGEGSLTAGATAGGAPRSTGAAAGTRRAELGPAIRVEVPGPSIEVLSPDALARSSDQQLPAAAPAHARSEIPSSVPALATPHAVSAPDVSTGLNFHLQPVTGIQITEMEPPPDVSSGPAPPDADPEAQQPASDAVKAAVPEVAEAAALQAAAVEALFAAGSFNSAAEQLEETTWAIADGELRIQTALSKAMLSTIFRADVEAVIKGALRNMGLTGLRLVFVPGTAAAKPATPRKPRSGSAQAKAMEHPTVQAAQRLFNAELTTVVDLRRD